MHNFFITITRDTNIIYIIHAPTVRNRSDASAISMFAFPFLTPRHALNNKEGRCNLLFGERFVICRFIFGSVMSRGIPRVVL